MEQIIKKATRESYGEALIELGGELENLVVLDADLSKSTYTSKFYAVYPEKFVNCGIAESNMMAVAAGLAASGMVPFASSFAMFAAGRAFEQVRNSIGYPHLNVKIGASHAGVSPGEDGATHQCLEDIALMRTIPGMVILSPSDHVEAKAAVKAAAYHEGPVYIRLARLAVPVFNDPETYHFELGKGTTLREGNDITIVATGLMVYEALKASDTLRAQGIHARVINIHTISPLDTEILVKAAQETGHIVTVEEHSVVGGLGEAVCSALCERAPVPVKRVGMTGFGMSGPATELMELYGLCESGIIRAVKELLNQ